MYEYYDKHLVSIKWKRLFQFQLFSYATDHNIWLSNFTESHNFDRVLTEMTTWRCLLLAAVAVVDQSSIIIYLLSTDTGILSALCVGYVSGIKNWQREELFHS